MSTGQSDLRLNPGPLARRERMSFCRCLVWTSLLALVLANAYFIPNFFMKVRDGTREPHKELYYKGDEKGADAGDVVRPLIDHHQTFDIMATIWLRTSVLNEGKSMPVEVLVYSDTLFNGLRLKDKDLHATVQYRIPTAIFKQENLTNYDLRASFILIPNTPSLLDYASNYSTWIPAHITVPPVRPYESLGLRSLEDEMIDSFALTVPLLDFLNITSSCNTSRTSNNDKPTKSATLEDDEDEDEDPKSIPLKKGQEERSVLDWAVVYQTTADTPQVLESHPYVITRTFLRVMDMTRLYDRKAYNKFHKELRQKSCPAHANETSSGLSWELCSRSFFNHGNMETRLKLLVPNPTTGDKTVQWAYAPYMSIAPFAWGPKDLVPIPINRENCTRTMGSDQEYVDINWTINFAGRTNDKNQLADILGVAGTSLAKFNMTAPEDDLKKIQFRVEKTQGLHGHRFNQEVHPRRYFIITVLGSIIHVVIMVLNAHYWYSLTSTIGISWPGTGLIALSDFLLLISRVAVSYSSSSYVWVFIKSLPFLLTPWLMMKALLRLEFGWWRGGYLPTLTFMPATHGEKANQRMNDAASRKIALTMFLVFCGVYHFIQPDVFGIINPSTNRAPKDQPLSSSIIFQVLTSVIPAASLVGLGMQLWFNYRSRMFAGQYRAAALLTFIAFQLPLLVINSRVGAGDFGHDGFSVHDLFHWIVTLLALHQAFKYPTVKKED